MDNKWKCIIYEIATAKLHCWCLTAKFIPGNYCRRQFFSMKFQIVCIFYLRKQIQKSKSRNGTGTTSKFFGVFLRLLNVCLRHFGEKKEKRKYSLLSTNETFFVYLLMRRYTYFDAHRPWWAMSHRPQICNSHRTNIMRKCSIIHSGASNQWYIILFYPLQL